MAPPSKWKIRLSSNRRECLVERDGERVPHVRSVAVSQAAGGMPMVTVTCFASEVEIEAETEPKPRPGPTSAPSSGEDR